MYDLEVISENPEVDIYNVHIKLFNQFNQITKRTASHDVLVTQLGSQPALLPFRSKRDTRHSCVGQI